MSMTTYCQNRVQERLEKVIEQGCVVITELEMKMWFDQARSSKTIWRDILGFWEEFVTNNRGIDVKTAPLMVGHRPGFSYTFIWGEGLKETSTSWFRDLASWT